MMIRCIYLILGIIAVLFTLAAESVIWRAYGAPPPGADGSLSEWFHSLKQPNGVSCCDISDCRQLDVSQWRVTHDGYEIRMNGDWVPVPWDRVLTHKDNPTGNAVACFNAETRVIYCFVRGGEV